MSIKADVPECYRCFHQKIQQKPLIMFIMQDIKRMIERALNIEIHLPPDLKVVEAAEYDFFEQARYDPIEKKLILRSDLYWCKITLVHETLHACSYFSHNYDEKKMEYFRPFIEALTEFLTGYVLYKEQSHCYKAWINRTYRICGLSIMYERGVRAFAVAARYIPLKDFVKIYIWQPNKNWEDEFKKFLSKYNLRIQAGITLISKFIRALEKAFGKDLLELIYEEPLDVCVDFSKIVL